MTGKAGRYSNYPNGFKHGVTIQGIPHMERPAGKVFWVGDGDTAGTSPTIDGRKTPSNGNKGDFLAPFKTVAYAISQCVAGRGDTIMVMPGYSEAISDVTTNVLNVDGVKIVGLGRGDNQARFTVGAASSAFVVTADNCTLEHLVFETTAAGTTELLRLTGANYTTVKNCWFQNDTPGTNAVLTGMIEFVTTASTDCSIEDCYFKTGTVASQDAAIHVNVAGCDRLQVDHNTIHGAFSVGCIAFTATSNDVRVINNTLINHGFDTGAADSVACVSLGATTGALVNNRLVTSVAGEAAITNTAGTAGITSAGNEIMANGGYGYPSIAATGTQNFNRASSQMRVAVADQIADENLSAFSITGDIAIWGLIGHVQTPADGTEDLAITTESGRTLIADGETSAATAAGDMLVATGSEQGGAVSVVEVAAQEGIALWSEPVILYNQSTNVLDLEMEGVGNMLYNLTLIYEPLSPEVTVLTSKA